MKTTTLTKTVMFSASSETVWAFLTDKDKLGEWFHPAEADLADGADYALTGENHDSSPSRICWGKVELWKPHSELAYTFTIAPLGGIETRVHWTLEKLPHGTRLLLEHSGIPAADEAAFGIVMALDKGWDTHFAKLRECA